MPVLNCLAAGIGSGLLIAGEPLAVMVNRLGELSINVEDWQVRNVVLDMPVN